jgi:hypothetical protein
MKLARGILVTAAVATLLSGRPAEAGLIDLGTAFLSSPLGSPSAEADWIEDRADLAHDLTYLNKWDAGGSGFDSVPPGAVTSSHFTVTPGGAETSQLITWDLAGTGYAAQYVLIKDGKTPEGHYYRLYEVTADQVITGTDTVRFTNPEKNISHIAWYGVPAAVPDGGATVALLGLGFIALGVARRKLAH